MNGEEIGLTVGIKSPETAPSWYDLSVVFLKPEKYLVADVRI